THLTFFAQSNYLENIESSANIGYLRRIFNWSRLRIIVYPCEHLPFGIVKDIVRRKATKCISNVLVQTDFSNASKNKTKKNNL
ncbi:hypothetical protein BpHYR1_016488, partial [Brachionus plicatilis]